MHLRRFFMMIIAALGVASCSDSEPAQTTAACPDVGAASDATSGDDTIDPGADAQLDAEGTDTASSDTDNGRFTCGPVLERIVPAPGYIRDGLGVHSYRYSLDFTEEITVLTLLDGEGEAWPYPYTRGVLSSSGRAPRAERSS